MVSLEIGLTSISYIFTITYAFSAINGPTTSSVLIAFQVAAVNLFGLVDVTMTFLPLIKKGQGRIVNTASVFGRHTLAGCAPYCISKYGVEAFTDGLRYSLTTAWRAIRSQRHRIEALACVAHKRQYCSVWKATHHQRILHSYK